MPGVHIDIEALSFRYEDRLALDGFGLEVPAGRITAVVGPSGAGKTTLLKLLAGLERPDEGDVRFDGASILGLAPEKRDLGVVFQSYALFPHLTVADNVAFGLRVRGLSRRRARARVAEVLERLEIAPLARRYPHQLSGGEKQRVALARALAFQPRAVLLDEPLAALDARLRLALRGELAERLRGAEVTALYITHDQEEAMALGDRVAVVRGGRLEQVGTPEELYRQPATPFVATFIGEANFLPVTWEPERRRLAGPLGEWTLDAVAAERFNGVRRGHLMVRPEAFRPASGGGGHLRGVVVSSTFLGDRRRLTVAVPGMDLKVDLPASASVATGSSLPLEIDFLSTVLLKELEPGDAVPPLRNPEGEESR